MKGAGSRTHMMVSLGAALMTLVSSYGFLPIVGAAGVSVDVSRVAASIAVGIGFLGAGVIYVHRGGVVGLTDGKGDLVRAGAEENHRARDRSQAAGGQFGKNRAVHCHAAAFR